MNVSLISIPTLVVVPGTVWLLSGDLRLVIMSAVASGIGLLVAYSRVG